jgi:hypothetical protein
VPLLACPKHSGQQLKSNICHTTTCFRPLTVLMYTNNDRQVVTPQLRRLAGRHARYFDYSLARSQLGACREMRRSARVKTPRCGATSSRVRRQPSNVAHRSDSLSLPGDKQGERPCAPGSTAPQWAHHFLFLVRPPNSPRQQTRRTPPFRKPKLCPKTTSRGALAPGFAIKPAASHPEGTRRLMVRSRFEAKPNLDDD